MKQKTEQEIRDAVLAFCERVCPESLLDCTPIGIGDLMIYKTESESNPCWNIGIIGRPKVLALIQPRFINSDRQIDEITVAYQLLGLETADAVEEAKKWESRAWKLLELARDKECEATANFLNRSKILSMVQAERTRSAALIAALEEIVNTSSDATMENDPIVDRWHAIAYAALEAHRKGGSNE